MSDLELEGKILKLLDSTVLLSSQTLKNSEIISKRFMLLMLAIIVSFTIIVSCATIGYFFSDYDYYESPTIENTNTNTLGGE